MGNQPYINGGIFESPAQIRECAPWSIGVVPARDVQASRGESKMEIKTNCITQLTKACAIITSMNKIILGVGTIAFAGALAFGATGAFFSDSQTSAGNTFTAGSIVLSVDDTQHYNNAVCTLLLQQATTTPGYYWELAPNQTVQPDQYPQIGSPCDGTWLPAPLGAHKFWNFGDVKPGDQGENTISLHVDTNPAWACMNVKVTGNAENGVVGPEISAGDNLLNGPFDGELAQNLMYAVWNDNGNGSGDFKGVAGDNIHQKLEPILVTPAAFATTTLIGPTGFTLPLADSTTGGVPLPGGSISNLGIVWCVGTLTMNTDGSFSCDGSSPSLNIVQTDSMTADVNLSIVQSRNNSSFRCTPVVAPTTGGLTVTKIVTGTTTVLASAFSIHVKTLGNADAVSPQPGSGSGNNYVGLTAGTFIVNETGPAASSTLFSVGCSATSTPFMGGAVTVSAGATSTCTVTNNFGS